MALRWAMTPTRPHVAMMVEASQIPQWPQPLLKYIHRAERTLPFTRRDEGMLLFWPVESAKSGR